MDEPALPAAAPAVEVPARSDVAADVKVFAPPFVGSRVAKGIPLDDIAAYINEAKRKAKIVKNPGVFE